jgi:hypothetical protein
MEALEKISDDIIVVPEELVKPHSLIRETSQLLRQMKADNYGCINARHLGGANIRATRDNIGRALRIADALFKALEKRGHSVIVHQNRTMDTFAVIKNEKVEICLEENVTQIDHVPTPKEIENQQRYSWSYMQKYDYVPSNKLALHINGRVAYYISQRTWRDRKNKPLEECLNDFITGLYEAAEFLKKDRIEEEIREKQRQEQQEHLYQMQLLQEAEQEKIEELNAEITNWRMSQEIRAYVAAMRTKNIEPGSELAKQLEWASKYADHLDPLVDFRIDILDEEFNRPY